MVDILGRMFICSHCNSPLDQIGEIVVVCVCNGSRNAELLAFQAKLEWRKIQKQKDLARIASRKARRKA